MSESVVAALVGAIVGGVIAYFSALFMYRRSALSHFPGPTIYRQRKFSHQGQHQLMMIMGVCLPMIAVTLQLDF